ncbi:MAG: hypothetical protein D6689_12420 [Deltaproteobacteria bacterium]|nr:MAG: hypothetical protein D6689_12420 [Deltaproteobacteria bacterium]
MRHEAPSAGATTNRPSARVLELERMSPADLERLFVDGATPDPDALAGWEFRGLNTPSYFKLLGIKKFIKGFFRKNGDLYGYNCPVVQNAIDGPWIAKPSDDQPKRFGFYRVDRVDPTARDNAYLHALLLDYGRGDNPRLDPSRGLRDYLVQPDRDNPDLYLGKAYYAVGRLRVPTRSFFILERHRPGLGDVVYR